MQEYTKTRDSWSPRTEGRILCIAMNLLSNSPKLSSSKQPSSTMLRHSRRTRYDDASCQKSVFEDALVGTDIVYVPIQVRRYVSYNRSKPNGCIFDAGLGRRTISKALASLSHAKIAFLGACRSCQVHGNQNSAATFPRLIGPVSHPSCLRHLAPHNTYSTLASRPASHSN